MERSLRRAPWRGNPLVPSLLPGTLWCYRPPFLPAQVCHAQRGFGGAETFPVRPAVSLGQCWLPAPATVVGCGPQLGVCLPTGIAAPRPHGSLSFPFPSLQDLLPAPTSWRPLSWGNKRQQSQNRTSKIKTTKQSGRQLRAVPARLRQWVSTVWWLLSLNKELHPGLNARARRRISLQGGGNQPWQHEQYPQRERMETGVFLPMREAINQP